MRLLAALLLVSVLLPASPAAAARIPLKPVPSLEKRGTMVSTRKPCRFVLITGSNGQQQWVSVCN